MKLKNLTHAHVQALYGEKLQNLSPTTVEHIHTTLHRALKLAVKWQLVRHNAADGATVPKRKSPEICPLNQEQAKAFLAAAEDDRLCGLYVLALTSGMRLGELLGLSWSDVDTSRRVVRVRRSLVTGYGKQTFEAPKTLKSRRSISLTKRAVDALEQHRQRQRDTGLPVGNNALVFTNTVGNPVNPSNLLPRSFKPLLKRARLPHIRFHDLRHTAATVLLSKNVNPKIVSDMLGHANILITLDTYSHVLPGMGDAASGAMNDALD